MWVDAHTHLDFYTADEIDGVLAQIRERQILSLANSMDLPSYQQTCKLAAGQDWIIPGLGIHPWQAMAAVDQLEAIRPFPKISNYSSRFVYWYIGILVYWYISRA